MPLRHAIHEFLVWRYELKTRRTTIGICFDVITIVSAAILDSFLTLASLEGQPSILSILKLSR